MLIREIEGATRHLGAPANWDHTKASCDVLPIADVMTESGPFMVSAWTPTAEELAALNAGAPVYLWIGGTSHPVVALNVAEAPKVEPSPQRAVVFRVDVQADTKDELSDVLFNLSNRVQGDDLSSHSVSGGYGSGYEHWLTVNDSPTHAEYVAQLDEYLKRKEAERAEGNRAPIDVHQAAHDRT